MKHNLFMLTAVVYELGVLGHFPPWDIFRLEGIKTFWLKKIRQEKIIKIHKDFEL